MGWLDALLGRSKPAQPNLDALFALPSAAVTLRGRHRVQAHRRRLGLLPRGGGRRVRHAGARRPATARRRVDKSPGRLRLHLATGAPPPDDVGALVTELHAVNSTLEGAGFGPSLLCSLVSFADPNGRRLAIVYLYKRGTFYPFAPLSGAAPRQRAGTPGPRRARDGELPIEPDLSRWFPVWGAPGL